MGLYLITSHPVGQSVWRSLSPSIMPEETNQYLCEIRVGKNEAGVSWSISHYSGGVCYHWTTGAATEGSSLTLAYLVRAVNYLIWRGHKDKGAVCYTRRRLRYSLRKCIDA
jgi:hypothetical protein